MLLFFFGLVSFEIRMSGPQFEGRGISHTPNFGRSVLGCTGTGGTIEEEKERPRLRDREVIEVRGVCAEKVAPPGMVTHSTEVTTSGWLLHSSGSPE